MSTFLYVWVQSTGGVFLNFLQREYRKPQQPTQPKLIETLGTGGYSYPAYFFVFDYFQYINSNKSGGKTIKPHQYIIIYMPIYLITDWGGYLGISNKIRLHPTCLKKTASGFYHSLLLKAFTKSYSFSTRAIRML